MKAMATVQLDPHTGLDRRAARRAGGCAGRRGFTLVEIMVVVGIILVLIGIAAIAYRSLDNPASGNSTKVTLQNLHAMLAEYEAAAGLNQRNQPVEFWYQGSAKTNKPNNPTFNVWLDPVIATNANVSEGASTRYAVDGLANTQRVLEILLKMSGNKQALGRLPSRQLHSETSDAVPDPRRFRGRVVANGRMELDPPLVLDAWGNPVLFVGSRGLDGVTIGSETGEKLVTSVGVLPSPPGAPPLPSSHPPPAGARPFFASAGPDGNFQTGDDNIYSFNP